MKDTGLEIGHFSSYGKMQVNSQHSTIINAASLTKMVIQSVTLRETLISTSASFPVKFKEPYDFPKNA